MTPDGVMETRASALRREFDLSFAAAPSNESHAFEDLIAVRVGADPYAIRLSEIAGIVVARPVVSLPSMRADVLGLAGIRGSVVPVFSLSSLLGYGRASDASRWMVLCSAPELVALAFSEFEGYLRLSASEINMDENARTQTSATGERAQHIARTNTGMRPVISMPAIVAIIARQAGPSRPAAE